MRIVRLQTKTVVYGEASKDAGTTVGKRGSKKAEGNGNL